MNREPAAPYKFGFGLVLLGMGFLALNVGGGSASAGMIPAIFMVFLYLLHTIGELTLSPVGLSLVTKLSPRHMVGFLMGIWLLSSSLAHQGGKHIAKLTTVNEKTIVESESFKNAKMDEDIKALLLTDDFKNKLEEGSVESVLTDSTFIAELNAKSEKDYAKSTVYISERLKAAESYKGSKKEKELSREKLIKQLKEKNSHLNQSEIETIINTFSQKISETLKNGNSVEIRGLGRFFVKTLKEKNLPIPSWL